MGGMDMTGKAAVVTGGSRGIGRAVCVELASRGADVAFFYAGNESAAAETLEALREYGVHAASYKCDISRGEDVTAAFKSVLSDFGAVDILVNNAGVTKDKLAMMMSEDDFVRVVDVNLTGAFRCSKAVIPTMIRKRSGKIINITSVAGMTGNAGQANYSSSKAGLIGLTKSLARELCSRGITCNAVAPGFVETDMTSSLPAGGEELAKSVPLGRFAKPQEIAKAVAFLASSDADYITGEVLRVDGGLAM